LQHEALTKSDVNLSIDPALSSSHRSNADSPQIERVRIAPCELRSVVDCDLLVLVDLFLACTITDESGALLRNLIHQSYELHPNVIVTTNRVVQDCRT